MAAPPGSQVCCLRGRESAGSAAWLPGRKLVSPVRFAAPMRLGRSVLRRLTSEGAPEACYPVVVDHESQEAVHTRESFELHNLVIRKIDAVELILRRKRVLVNGTEYDSRCGQSSDNFGSVPLWLQGSRLPESCSLQGISRRQPQENRVVEAHGGLAKSDAFARETRRIVRRRVVSSS